MTDEVSPADEGRVHRAPPARRKARRRLVRASAVALAGALGLFVGYCASGPHGASSRLGWPAQPRADTTAQAAPPVATADTLTLTDMRNVHFRIDDAIALRIRYLRGEVRPTHAAAPIDFGDKGSFQIGIRAAEVGLTARDLTLLMNRYVFAYPDAPLTDLDITTEGPQIRQKGTVHKVVGLPFEILADVQATPDGRIRLHPTKIKVFSVSSKGLLKTLGLQLDELLDVSGAEGVTVEDNDLFLDPDHLLPPPAIRGRVAAVRVEGDEVVLRFGAVEDSLSQAIEQLERPDPGAANYLYFHGGTLHFGKLFMVAADLQIIDEAPKDPFDFYIDHYVDQLVAGYSRTRPDFGLEAYMPDYDKLGSAAGAPSQADPSPAKP